MPPPSLKSTVTRRPPADVLVDQEERIRQSEHHQAAEAAAAVQATDATPITEATKPEPPASTKQDPHALQSAFLAGNLGKPITVFLVNGIRLVGTLKQFDHYCLLLEGTYDIETLIFKHMISTIVPASR